jgi:hypothetical protein
MSTQDPLFHEDFNDALHSAVKALGKIEAVARDLWPAKPNGGRYLSDCLNPDRDAKLALEDVVALLKMAREKGVHWAMHQLCDSVGYERPGIAPAKTPNQERAERMAQLLSEFRHLADEEAAAQNAAPQGLRRVL